MPQRSPLDYDISVAADKRRRARERRVSGVVETSTRHCEWPGCDGRGAYRAPSAPERLHDYRWFCLDHVREYNRAWNYFDGWSADDLDAQGRADRTWERPTWTLRDGLRRRFHGWPHAEGRAWARWGFKDPLEVLGDAATRNPGEPADRPRRFRPLGRDEQRALDTLGLGPEVEARSEVRARYRELVKDLHPDMNDGARHDEARLARVIRAWDILKRSPNFHD